MVRYILTALISAVIGFASCYILFEKANWRVFVLHDSEKVNIKVR